MPRSSTGSSRRSGFLFDSRHRAFELAPGLDAELGEHLVEVPFDRAGTEEELRADLGIRPALDRQPRDEQLAGRELVARLDGALARFRARREQFMPRAFGE